MLMVPSMTVRDVARQIGVHPETIRRWERSGLIDHATRRCGRRVYDEADVRRIVGRVLDRASELQPSMKEGQ